MSTPSFYFRNMLNQYDRQLVAARRLSRLQTGLGMPAAFAAHTENETAPEQKELSPAQARRATMVEHVAREMLENLLFTGTDSPIVNEFRQELEDALGAHFTFHYLPGVADVQIIREDADGKRELGPEEREETLRLLWKITLAKVDATML